MVFLIWPNIPLTVFSKQINTGSKDKVKLLAFKTGLLCELLCLLIKDLLLLTNDHITN
jgi:hypothetical protein